MSDGITLECPDCGKSLFVDREDFDPLNATTIRLQCTGCDDGDRHSPEYFDAAGKWINPAPSPTSEITRLSTKE